MSFFGRISGFLSSTKQNKAQEKQDPAKKKQRTEIAGPPVIPIRSKAASHAQKSGEQSPPKQSHTASISNHPIPPTAPRPEHLESSEREIQARAREIIVEAKNEALIIRERAEAESRKLRQELTDKERSLDQKLSAIDARLKLLDERDRRLQESRDQLEQQRSSLEQKKQELNTKLEEVAGISKEQAKDMLFSDLEMTLTREMAQKIEEAERTAKEEADEKAKEILVDAMRHGATTYVPEYTVSVVKIPDDESKGRIIGKDGRNIRAFELATGVDIELDDQPGTVRLSCFDPVRREIARVSLERLIKDGRIHPANIEKTIMIVKKELDKIMFEEGKKLCHTVGIYNLPGEIMQTLGRFKYRFSYGQNLILHTIEETKIGVAIAEEIGANVEIVKLGCLLHDIGKALPDEEGSHIETGVRYLRRFKLPKEVIDCVEQHQEDVPFSSIESKIVYISDAISGSRPGARYENYDEYIQRLTKLEDIAKSYEEVKEAYAIQAGREVRVILKAEKSKDADVKVLSLKIKDRVQQEMTYPGTVTVTVLREVRSVDVAK